MSITDDLLSVHGFFKHKAYEWDSIGRELKVDFGFRQSLAREGVQTDDRHKLENVLHQWYKSECSPSTWENLLNP